MKNEITKLLANQFYDVVPFNVAIIDREFNIVHANSRFKKYFGALSKQKCYEVYKKSDKPCTECQANHVFETGEPAISNESGKDKNDNHCHYTVHLAPLKDNNGKVKYIVEMSTDITETTNAQKNYNLLFEKVPSYVTIIDKDFKIVRANKRFRDTFGDTHGKHCYEVYKKNSAKCRRCPASKTFKDGKDHFSSEIGMTFSGDETRYLVNTTALSKDEDGTKLVIEIAADITEIVELQDTIRKSHDFYATLIENSDEGILAINERKKTIIFNSAAKKILGWKSNKKPVISKIQEMMPVEFFKRALKNGTIIKKDEASVFDIMGNEIPVRFNAIELRSKREIMGRVAFFQDLRLLKEIESKRIEAERLGAVGQTVAGLAHTIKNVLMGLEGGMYIVDTGLRKGEAARIVEGWEILQRNFYKTTDLVKGFLSFAKGRIPELSPTNPNKIVEDILELYKDSAAVHNIELKAKLGKTKQLYPLDSEGIEACLTNLISNAIDAAMMREDGKGVVEVVTNYRHSTLTIDINDNGCGMDSEVIQRIFTTFFTTKGNKGTGLGLLTVSKIVKEHGGTLEVESEVNKGSTFRMIFPLKRLEMLVKQSNKL